MIQTVLILYMSYNTTPNTKTSLVKDLILHTTKYQRTTTTVEPMEVFPPLAGHYDNDDEHFVGGASSGYICHDLDTHIFLTIQESYPTIP